MKYQWVKKSTLALLLVSPSLLAVPPTHDISELPQLQQEDHHDTAAERATAYFTRYHFSQPTLNN